MTEHTFNLTRRKALAGLGAIGAAGAGAGLGTSALFSDEESFTSNTIDAGTLDLLVDYETSVEQDGVPTGSNAGNGTNDGENSTINGSGTLTGEGVVSGEYVVSDLKPGDSGRLQFDPKLVDNPGWVWVGSQGLSEAENGRSEPERAVDDTPNQGELASAIQVTVSYDDPNGGMRALNNPANYSLAALFKELESGFLLDGEPFSGDPSGTQPYPRSPDSSTQSGPGVVIEWAVPTSVGNEIQSDSLTFDITFAAAQERHNEIPSNPFADATVGPGESIASAVSGASGGDVISVHGSVGGGVSVSEQVVIDKSLTLARAGAARPTIDGAGSSPAVRIDADGVTVDGFAITNPGQLLGIKVGQDYDDATICNNRIHDIGPTGNLGVSGVIVGQGDHTGIRIFGNVIENLEQTDDGSFATLNGIIFDADNNSPGIITDTSVVSNTITDLESTTAPLGVVVQHNVENLRVESNSISALTADNSLGPGSFTTFAQGLSIDAPSVNGFEIVDNTIEDVVSEDGFFAEAIKVEPGVDVSGIDIRRNNLLSAIGLNNADGTNPSVTAAENYWGSTSGPFEIENNDDDGDVPTGSGQVDLETVTASAVTKNVDYQPFASSQQ